jgi:hypothetical protein
VIDAGEAAARRVRARALRLHCLRHDVVESAGRESSTLLAGVLFSLLVALVVSGLVADRPSTLFALLGIFVLVDALGDAATAFLDPRDLPLLRTSPVPAGEYARARLAALAFGAGVKSASLALPPVAACLASGDVRRAGAFLLAFAAMSATLHGAAILLLFVARRMRPSWRPHVLLAWLRALALVGGTGAALLLHQRVPVGEPRELAALDSLPSGWFSELFRALAGEGAIRPALAGAALGALAAAALALAWLAKGYVALLEDFERSPPPGARRRSPLARAYERLFVSRGERPAFRLGLALLRREKTFRWQTLPLLGFPLLFLWLGREVRDDGLFALLFAQLPALVLVLACHFLNGSDSPAGGFVVRFHGGAGGRSLQLGARKALWFAVAAPLAAIAAVLLAWEHGIAFGLLHGALGLLSSTIAVVATPAAPDEVPFAAPFGSGRGEGGDSAGGRAFGLLFGLVALALVEWGVLRSLPYAGVALPIAAAIGVLALLRRHSATDAALAWNSALEEFKGAKSREPVAALAFAPRLRRELRGLAVFFALAGLALTAFFAWI